MPPDIFSNFFIKFLDFFKMDQIRSTEFATTRIPRPNHVLNQFFSHLFHFPSDFDPLPAISFVPQLLISFPSSILPIFTSINVHFLQIRPCQKPPNLFLQTLTGRPLYPHMAPKARTKRKGNEVSREESPPIFDHSGYPSIEAFKSYSLRTIIFDRIPNFEHLGFMHFNALMRRMG